MATASVAALLLAILPGGAAHAAASGPDYWDVTGVRADDVLNLHTQASARSATILGIPPDGKGLKNLGCSGVPTFAEWTQMSEADRRRAARARWCQVEYMGRKGWVAGRFLKEGAEPAAAARPLAIGPWTLRCAASCALEQTALGTTRRTVLRIEPREGVNAEFTISRNGIARQGVLAVYMDGKTITQGPIGPLATRGAGRLVLSPDDITLGLVRQMKVHKNMVLSFPGEERGAEIHLDQFDEAWRAVMAKPAR